MPGLTKLDKLIKQLRGFAKPKADIIQETTIRDPLSYPLEQRHPFGRKPGSFPIHDITPERVKYQRGLNVLQQKGVDRAEEELAELRDDYDHLQSQFDDAFEEAKSDMIEDWRYGVDDETALDLREGFDPARDLKVSEPNTDINDYWPSNYDTPEEFLNKADHLDTDIDEWEGIVDYRSDDPRYREELQRQSPRYRNYQRAMADRAANQRLGHQIARYKAEVQRNQIMRLRQMGYSPAQIRAMMTMTGQYSIPETREILRNQRF